MAGMVGPCWSELGALGTALAQLFRKHSVGLLL